MLLGDPCPKISWRLCSAKFRKLIQSPNWGTLSAGVGGRRSCLWAPSDTTESQNEALGRTEGLGRDTITQRIQFHYCGRFCSWLWWKGWVSAFSANEDRRGVSAGRWEHPSWLWQPMEPGVSLNQQQTQSTTLSGAGSRSPWRGHQLVFWELSWWEIIICQSSFSKHKKRFKRV